MKKKIGSEHTPTTRTLGEISKQNRATHSDEKENTINIFRRSNSTMSCKLLSFDAGVNEISIKNENLKGGNLGLGCSRALRNPAIGAQPVL